MNYKAKALEIESVMNEIRSMYSYETVIHRSSSQGWFHMTENPLSHDWHSLNMFEAYCRGCGMLIERKIKFK
jgi:hypothetical protein